MIMQICARHCSAASLLLVAGIALMIAEGPLAYALVGSLYGPTELAPSHAQLGARSTALASAGDGVDGKTRGETLKKGAQ